MGAENIIHGDPALYPHIVIADDGIDFIIRSGGSRVWHLQRDSKDVGERVWRQYDLQVEQKIRGDIMRKAAEQADHAIATYRTGRQRSGGTLNNEWKVSTG